MHLLHLTFTILIPCKKTNKKSLTGFKKLSGIYLRNCYAKTYWQ